MYLLSKPHLRGDVRWTETTISEKHCTEFNKKKKSVLERGTVCEQARKKKGEEYLDPSWDFGQHFITDEIQKSESSFRL